MKILLDPITTAKPHKCSCHFKFQNVARALIESREDMFVYYLLPGEWEEGGCTWEVDMDKMYQHERLRYILTPTFKDRYKEYVTPPQEWVKAVFHGGLLWDTDMMITARSTMVPVIRQLAHHVQAKRDWNYRVVVIDGFPLMKFKPYAYPPEIASMELQVLTGYLAADKVMVFTPYEVKGVLDTSKIHLSPSRQKELRGKLSSAQPSVLGDQKLKTKEVMTTLLEKKKNFTVAYVQRIENRRRYREVFEVMRSKWILSKDDWPIECLITTVSEGGVDNDDDLGFIQTTKADREQFYSYLDERIDVILNLSKDEGFSLSTMEPLMRGVPIILGREPWSVALVGEDYPFFVDKVTEAYLLLKRFHANYVEEYVKFAAWQKDVFRPMIAKRSEESLYAQVLQFVGGYEQELQDKYANDGVTISNPAKILDEMGKEDFILTESIRELKKTKEMTLDLTSTTWPRSHTTTLYAFVAPLRMYRQDLIYHFGYKDATVVTGHLKK